jgi:MFS family permease
LRADLLGLFDPAFEGATAARFSAGLLGRRKPVYLGGAAIMLIGFVQLIYFPTLLPTWLTLFILGVASGAAMIPYTIIKEVNPDEVKGVQPVRSIS